MSPRTLEEWEERLRSEVVRRYSRYGKLAMVNGGSGGAALVRRVADNLPLVFRAAWRRVDRASDGTIRVIDYKTAGPSDYKPGSLERGKKIQLPLYALAVREALGLGEPVEGFYWHVRHGEPSKFTLSGFGPEEAMRLAVAHAWEAVRGARAGDFTPHPPTDGCADHCPAVSFCWHYRPHRTSRTI